MGAAHVHGHRVPVVPVELVLPAAGGVAQGHCSWDHDACLPSQTHECDQAECEALEGHRWQMTMCERGCNLWEPNGTWPCGSGLHIETEMRYVLCA